MFNKSLLSLALASALLASGCSLAGQTVAIAWKRFDGSRTLVESRISRDGGQRFEPGPTLSTTEESDQPRVLAAAGETLLFWLQADRISVVPVTASSAGPMTLRTFGPGSLREIEQAQRGHAFWLVLWDLECPYCMKSLRHLAAAQRLDHSVRAVTITTDPIGEAEPLLVGGGRLEVTAREDEPERRRQRPAFARDVERDDPLLDRGRAFTRERRHRDQRERKRGCPHPGPSLHGAPARR